MPKIAKKGEAVAPTKSDFDLKAIEKSLAKVDPKFKRTEDAYRLWLKNPALSFTAVCIKNRMHDSTLRKFINKYKLPRMDKKKIEGGKSDRQKWIAECYQHAVKNNLSGAQAATWGCNESGFTIDRGDIQYYAMKNDLPYLPEQKML